jgi:hypothetical protein
MANNQSSPEGTFTRHLILVLCLLAALLLTILAIFIFTKTEANVKDYLSLTFTTFGAWIGAGAAYFFGRENLKTTTESMLKAGGVSAKDKLAQTSLRELPLRPISDLDRFKRDTKVPVLRKWFDDNRDRYFAVVVNDIGKIDTALHYEGLMDFILHKKEEMIEKGEQKEAIDNAFSNFTLGAVLTYLNEEAMDLKKQSIKAAHAVEGLAKCAVILKESDSVKTARDMMEQNHLLVTVVTDATGTPGGYITNTEIEKLMLS